jgi:hypothetical protein
MVWACSTHGGNEKLTQFRIQKTLVEIPCGKRGVDR